MADLAADSGENVMRFSRFLFTESFCDIGVIYKNTQMYVQAVLKNARLVKFTGLKVQIFLNSKMA